MKTKILDFGTYLGVSSQPILSYERPKTQSYKVCQIPSLSRVIEALQGFQGFASPTRNAAIALYANELADECGWRQSSIELHLQAIASILGGGA